MWGRFSTCHVGQVFNLPCGKAGFQPAPRQLCLPVPRPFLYRARGDLPAWPRRPLFLPAGVAMSARPFVHLHCHTHYSLLDGANRVPELVAHVKQLGMNACAITDHGNLFGAIEFYQECRSAGINPVIGYEAYVAPSKRTE